MQRAQSPTELVKLFPLKSRLFSRRESLNVRDVSRDSLLSERSNLDSLKNKMHENTKKSNLADKWSLKYHFCATTGQVPHKRYVVPHKKCLVNVGEGMDGVHPQVKFLEPFQVSVVWKE